VSVPAERGRRVTGAPGRPRGPGAGRAGAVRIRWSLLPHPPPAASAATGGL